MANKIQHNNSITTGDFGFSGGVVTSISGFPVGGTGGTIIGGSYFGDDETIDVNQQTRIISIHSYTKEKIDNIPHKVSDLTDSANYQPVSAMTAYWTSAETVEVFAETVESLEGLINGKQDKLTFAYDNDKISAINGSALVGEGGDGNYSAGIDLKIENNIISVDTNGNPNNTATNNHNFVEGSWTVASGYMNHAEGAGTSALGYGVHAQGMWTCFSSSKWGDNTHIDTDIYWAVGAGATVEGYCNATTSCPMSGSVEQSNYGPIHGGILKVIGNGYIEHDQQPDPDAHTHTHHPSDALIIYRDGCISAAGNISANGIELGAGGGGTSYQGRNGVNVDGGYIELTTTAYNAVTSVSSKVDKPTSMVDKYLVLRTKNDGSVSGWVDLKDNFYSKSEADGRYQKIADMSNYLTTAKYATDSATFVTNSKLETVSGEITALIPKNYVTSGDYISGNSQYALTSGGWAKVQEGGLSLPVNVGTGNDVTQISAIGAIGNNCSAGTKSFAFSYKGATASNNSFAINDDNVADHNSFAWGWANTADNYSMAGGNATSADEHSFALGNAVYTKYWTLGIGRGLEFNGDSNSNTGIGALVAGGWNKTSSNAIFVLGNGTGNGSYRSDAVVVDRSGNTKINGSLTTNVASGQNILAVASAASLIGASRQTSENYGVNNSAIGTTWFGVGSNGMHQGFIKYTDGGDVGALDSNSMIQLNFKPSTNKFDSIQVQINNNHVGYLIPAVTSTTTAGLTDDGILHIIIESNN